ncbi:MAG TPA: hypothetical protein VGG64_10030 [Pirellulales bacterium]|jgi:hypothetical protein
MGKKRRYNDKRHSPRPIAPAPAPAERRAAAAIERKAKTEYDKPFILLENADKDTFMFKAGQWARHSMSIAEYRENSLVKELAQKVNGMTRYEIRYPISHDA